MERNVSMSFCYRNKLGCFSIWYFQRTKLALTFPDQFLRLSLHLRGRHSPLLLLRAGAVLQSQGEVLASHKLQRTEHLGVIADEEADQCRNPDATAFAKISTSTPASGRPNRFLAI